MVQTGKSYLGGARTAYSETMRPILYCALVIVLAVIPKAEARRVRHKPPTPFSVVLEPFKLTRSVVHAAARPIVHNAPRVLAATAVAPIKLAYYAPRHLRPRPPRGAEDTYDADNGAEGHATRVSDRSSSGTGTRAPEQDEDSPDQDQQEEIGRVERRGEQPMVSGNRAILRNGIAYAPSNAPQSVKNAIWAANTLRRKPYVWGGGHGSFYDRGYDCSGTVSFALHGAGILNSPLPSSDLMRYGERGRGRWMTIYSRNGHTFAVIAGLRLDTTDLGRGGDVGPRWYDYGRDTSGYVARHPVGM